MPFKIAYSTNAYTRYSLQDAIEGIADLGFAGIEILADIPHLFSDTPQSEIAKLKALLLHKKIEISNINANTAAGLEYFDDRRIAHTKKIIEIAGMLGAPNISFAIEHPFLNMRYILNALRELGDFAKKFGIKIGIEYEPDFFISNCDQLLKILQDLNHPNIGANLDIGHSVVNGENPADVIRKLNDKIWNIHIEDIKGRSHYHLIPGKGDIDFKAIRDALIDTKYDRWLTLEIYTYKDNPSEAGRESLDFLKRIFCESVL